jgi:isopenicillin-N epimerase
MTSSLRHAWILDDDVAFLNHGSFGATPRSVLAVQARLRDQMEREPVRFFDRFLPGALEAARVAVARWVHADPAGLAFLPNTSMGVSTVLANQRFGPGDELLVTDHAYAACRNAFAHAAAASGATLVTARVPFPGTTADAVVAAVLEALTPRTRLVLIDHVTSPTGLVFPIERILPELARRGIPALVDGAHAPGMVDVDLTALAALGATYYTANGHKWPCAPKGAAFLWVDEPSRAGFHPLVISHGLLSPLVPGQTRFRAEMDWTGTDDPTAYLAWPTAIEHVGELMPGGWPAIRRRNHELALAAQARLAEALGIARPAEAELIGSLASLPIPAERRPELDARGLYERLIDAHRVEVPVFPWPDSGRVLRVAMHLHSDMEDIERLVGALAAEGLTA